MDAKSNVALRAIALRTDVEEIEAEAEESMILANKGGACPCGVALARLSHVKAQLRGLRQRCGGDPPPEVEEASDAFRKAEKRLPLRCGRGRSLSRPTPGAKEAA